MWQGTLTVEKTHRHSLTRWSRLSSPVVMPWACPLNMMWWGHLTSMVPLQNQSSQINCEKNVRQVPPEGCNTQYLPSSLQNCQGDERQRWRKGARREASREIRRVICKVESWIWILKREENTSGSWWNPNIVWNLVTFSKWYWKHFPWTFNLDNTQTQREAERNV